MATVRPMKTGAMRPRGAAALRGSIKAKTTRARIADAATPEVVDAFARLLPQLSSSAPVLTRELLTEIIVSTHNTVLLAHDPSAGGHNRRGEVT